MTRFNQRHEAFNVDKLGSDYINYLHKQLEETQQKLITMNQPPSLRPIKFTQYARDPVTQRIKSPLEHETLTGSFHCFSTEGDSGESGPVAVIETADGQLHVADVRKCKFLDK